VAAKVFISYRRDDAKWQAREIYRSLLQVLPRDHVFMDIDTIPMGADYIAVLEAWVDQCDILLALIGPGWVDATDPKTGRRRLDNPNDFVRIEIRKGLARGIPVVPVLLDGAQLPDAGRLPQELHRLLRYNAAFIEHRTVDADVDRLIRGLPLQGSVSTPAATGPSPPGPELAQSSDRALEEASAGPSASALSTEELTRRIQGSLMDALGLHLAALDRLREPAVAGHALAAAHALRQIQAPSHHSLHEHLKLVESENRRALEAAEEALATQLAHDGRALGVLRESVADIAKLLPALVLLPGLFDRMMIAFEEILPDNALTVDEKLLLKYLHGIKSELAAMDWRDPHAWKAVRLQIEVFVDAPETERR
jgi:hypothetical protein